MIGNNQYFWWCQALKPGTVRFIETSFMLMSVLTGLVLQKPHRVRYEYLMPQKITSDQTIHSCYFP